MPPPASDSPAPPPSPVAQLLKEGEAAVPPPMSDLPAPPPSMRQPSPLQTDAQPTPNPALPIPAPPIPPPIHAYVARFLTPAFKELLDLARAAGLEAPRTIPPAWPNTSPGYPLFDPDDYPLTPSRLNPLAWAGLLHGYPDPTFVTNILGMIGHGAKLGYEGPLRATGRPSSGVPNLKMEANEKVHVRTSIDERVEKGYAIPFVDSRLRDTDGAAKFVASPVGTVPKAGGKLRTINHLSWPRSNLDNPSINEGIVS